MKLASLLLLAAPTSWAFVTTPGHAQRGRHVLVPRASLEADAEFRTRLAVVEALRGVTVEDSDVVSRGWVSGVTATAATLTVELELPAGFAYDEANDLAARCEQATEAVRDALREEAVVASDCQVNVEAALPREEATEVMTPTPEDPLSGVKKVVAVSSCKGGVGKSTVAVNLACAWAAQGLKVGLCDVDVYGPSLPTLMGPLADPRVRTSERSPELLEPFSKFGLKLMSFGFLNDEAAMMRGSRVAGVVEQLANRVDWGALDVLVVDTPPGTGDAQLTLCQSLTVDAAVVVTTPSRLAFTDVVKGVQLFDTVNVPVVAVVENMAGFKPCSSETAMAEAEQFVESQTGVFPLSGDARARFVEDLATFLAAPRRPFGDGHKRQLSQMWGLDNFVDLELSPDVAKRGDAGTPLFFLQDAPSVDEAEAIAKFNDLAKNVWAELQALEDDEGKPDVTFDGANVVVRYRGHETLIPPRDLRALCRCAVCLPLAENLSADDFPPDYKPVTIANTGNYAIAVTWSDGHPSLLPFKSFVPDYGRRRSSSAVLEEERNQHSAPTTFKKVGERQRASS